MEPPSDVTEPPVHPPQPARERERGLEPALPDEVFPPGCQRGQEPLVKSRALGPEGQLFEPDQGRDERVEPPDEVVEPAPGKQVGHAEERDLLVPDPEVARSRDLATLVDQAAALLLGESTEGSFESFHGQIQCCDFQRQRELPTPRRSASR